MNVAGEGFKSCAHPEWNFFGQNVVSCYLYHCLSSLTKRTRLNYSFCPENSSTTDGRVNHTLTGNVHESRHFCEQRRDNSVTTSCHQRLKLLKSPPFHWKLWGYIICKFKSLLTAPPHSFRAVVGTSKRAYPG